MSYNPLTDFLALIRTTAGVAYVSEMPGLDYVLAALARAGMFSMSVGQDPPLTNQTTTLWFKPSLPSWVAEGVPYIYDVSAGGYVIATAELWAAFLIRSGADNFQSVVQAAANVGNETTLLAIERASPAATLLTLPSVAVRGGQALQIVDWSSPITNHTITLAPTGGQTIMRRTAFQLLSTVDQLAGVTLHPSTDLNGWIIAP